MGNREFMTDSLNELANALILIEEKHSLVASKLLLALEQLKKASSLDEYQQIGILIRDAWIEFAQKIFIKDYVPGGAEIPSQSDAKKMLDYTTQNWRNCPKKLIGLSKQLYDLATEIQHDRNVLLISVKWDILITIFTMSLLLELDSENQKLADRRYYKCPKCGNINLSFEKEQEIDSLDGPLYWWERWKCEVCDWEHFLILD